MVSRPAKSLMAVQKTVRPARKPAPRGGDWSAGFLEARRLSKENRKSKSRRSKWPAARGKDHWQTKKEPGRRENQRREEANGQSTGEKYLGSPKDRPAGGKTSTASRIPGSAEAVQSKRKSKSRGRILAAHSGTMAETWSIMFRNISTTTFMNDRMEHGEKAIMSKESILQRRFCECGLESYVIKKRRRIFIHESFDIKFRYGFPHGSSDF